MRSHEPGAFFFRLHPLDLGHEPADGVGQEGGHDAEHGVTEAADVHDVTRGSGPDAKTLGPTVGPPPTEPCG